MAADGVSARRWRQEVTLDRKASKKSMRLKHTPEQPRRFAGCALVLSFSSGRHAFGGGRGTRIASNH
jgi:hypothetical protein